MQKFKILRYALATALRKEKKRKEERKRRKIPKIVVTTFAAANRLHSDRSDQNNTVYSGHYLLLQLNRLNRDARTKMPSYYHLLHIIHNSKSYA